jgi:Fur family ferric uptake transcriptional regulator
VSDARVAAILDKVRSSGGRVTSSRRALVTELVGGGGHLTAEDLVERLRASHPDLAESTVYRLLADLEDRQLVRHVHLVHGPAVYHLNDDVHHHLLCTRCGKVTDIPAEVLQPLTDALRDDHHFRFEPGHSALQGTCEACARELEADHPH